MKYVIDLTTCLKTSYLPEQLLPYLPSTYLRTKEATYTIYNTYTTYIRYVLAFPWRYTPSPMGYHHFIQAAKEFYFLNKRRASSVLQNIQIINDVYLDKADLGHNIYIYSLLRFSNRSLFFLPVLNSLNLSVL